MSMAPSPVASTGPKVLSKRALIFGRLPNIDGTSLLAGFVTPESGAVCGNGPFAGMRRWVQNFVVTDGSDSSVLEFDASLANAQYGAADTVQPSSLRALVLIRSF